MSPSPQLAPAGSSTYSSNTMYVGDGTWDSSRNTFLLPNLVGLNFETMQYNGMRNRFLNMPGYHSLIRGHGIVAAITFLGIIPAAIFIAAFYVRNPRRALHLHICLQILTVLLSTVVFVLGWFAVGSARSLTNPHHGVGLTIYVLIWVQAIGGALTHHAEKGKERLKLPLKLFLHQWLGRAVALLGFIQVALGLTLYGSPKVLFILYALWGFLLLVLYLALTFHFRPQSGYYDDGSSYFTGYTGERTELTEDRRSRRRGHGLGALAAAGAAGAGLAAMRHRSQSRRRSRSRAQDEVISSRHSSRSSRRSSSVHNEKYGDNQPKQHTWRNRLLGAGAGLGAIAAVRSLFNRKKEHEVSSEDGSYGPPVAGSRYRPPPGGASIVSQTDVSRVEEGRAPESPANDRSRRNDRYSAAPAAAAAAAAGASMTSPSRRASMRSRRRSGESITSYSSFSDETHDRPPREFGLKEGIAVLGVAGFLKHKLGQRKRNKEDARVEALRREDMEKERIARMNSERRRYTGDGTPGPRRGGRTGSFTDDTETDFTGSTPALSRHNLPRPSQSTIPPVPIPYQQHQPPSQSTVPLVPPPHQQHPPPQMQGSQATLPMPAPVPIPMPSPYVPPPGHESGSEEYFSAGGRPHRRHHQIPDAHAAVPAPAATGLTAGAAAAEAHRDSSRQRSSGGASVNSPPVSVKVKMHQDGRHVTLRRLNEEEAAAERDHRRKERQRRNRTGSVSSMGNADEERWRRAAGTEGAQAQQQQMNAPSPSGYSAVPPGQPVVGPSQSNITPIYDPSGLPPPPAAPFAAGSAMGSSPAGTGTQMSQTSNYDTNRRRRRAERARERAEKGGGSRVEFT